MIHENMEQIWLGARLNQQDNLRFAQDNMQTFMKFCPLFSITAISYKTSTIEENIKTITSSQMGEKIFPPQIGNKKTVTIYFDTNLYSRE